MPKAKGRKISLKKPKAKPAATVGKAGALQRDDVDRTPASQHDGPPHTFVQPLQCPPSGREYLRALVGKQGKPVAAGDPGKPQADNAIDRQAGNYFVQLTTFHVRDRGF
jgi:hypothetical protein